jgi:cytochrome b561
MASMIIGMLVLGVVMVNYPFSPMKLKLFSVHKAIGFTLLMLFVLRVVVRLSASPPARPSMAHWQRKVAACVHGLLYVALLAMPVSGLIINSAAGFPLNWFGMLAIAPLTAVDPELQRSAEFVHLGLAITIAALVLVHIGAALHHQFVARDGLLRRMWF